MKHIKATVKNPFGTSKAWIAVVNFAGCGVGADAEFERGTTTAEELSVSTYVGATIAYGLKGEKTSWGIVLADGRVLNLRDRNHAADEWAAAAEDVCIERSKFPAMHVAKLIEAHGAEIDASVSAKIEKRVTTTA